MVEEIIDSCIKPSSKTSGYGYVSRKL